MRRLRQNRQVEKRINVPRIRCRKSEKYDARQDRAANARFWLLHFPLAQNPFKLIGIGEIFDKHLADVTLKKRRWCFLISRNLW